MVRVIMTQTENTKQMCEFQSQSILVPVVLSIVQYLCEGNWFQAQFRLYGIEPKLFLN